VSVHLLIRSRIVSSSSQCEENEMATQRLGVILSGVTGRIGVNQHLGRALVPLRDTRSSWPMATTWSSIRSWWPQRGQARAGAKRFGIERWTTDLDAALSDTRDTLFFDSATTNLRFDNVRRALAAGKHAFLRQAALADARASAAIDRLRTARAAEERRGDGQPLAAGTAQAQDRWRTPASSGACCTSVASMATGCSRATAAPVNARRGTIASMKAAASCST